MKKPENRTKLEFSRRDYLFIVGAPVAFLLIATIGILWILGPAPPKNPVKLIKEGSIKSGMSIPEVEKILGLPKEMSETESGGLKYLYFKSSSEAFVGEEGIVEFSSTGQVVRTSVEEFRGVPPENRP